MITSHNKIMCAGLILMLISATPALRASDWPTYRGDAARSGYTSEPLPLPLPDGMRLMWDCRRGGSPVPAWPRSDRLPFDRANHVVVQ